MGEDKDWALSHIPLVWMVHEAQCVGLHFESNKLKQFHCFDDSIDGVVRITRGIEPPTRKGQKIVERQAKDLNLNTRFGEQARMVKYMIVCNIVMVRRGLLFYRGRW